MVKNRGNKTLTFAVKAIYLKQTANGQMTPAGKNEVVERSLIKNLRFSPKRTTLKPGESQTVRIMLRNVGQLEEGDYRLHLKFLPKEPTHEFKQGKDKKGVGMNLNMRLSIAIPVIYRHGKPKDKVEIKKFKVYKAKKKGYFFKALIKKSGNTFPMGTITVYKKSGKSDWEQIGIVKGITLYLKERMFKYPLREYKSSKLKGKFKIKFSRSKDVGGDVLFESTYDYDKDRLSTNTQEKIPEIKKTALPPKKILKKKIVRVTKEHKQVDEFKFSDKSISKKEENYWFKFETPQLDTNKINIEIITDNGPKLKETTHLAEVEIAGQNPQGVVIEVKTKMSGNQKIQISPQDSFATNTKTIQGPEGELIELSFELMDSGEEYLFSDKTDTRGLVGLFENFNKKIKKNLPKYKHDLKVILDRILEFGQVLKEENHADEKIINKKGNETL